MLTVHDAVSAILDHVQSFESEATPLADSLGLVLAEDIVSDLDSPPFDKALMDGFAVRAADIVDGNAILTLIDEVAAGRVAEKTVGPGETIQIMTGAPIPNGADGVVRVEDTEIAESADGAKLVKIATSPVSAGTNMIHRGTSMKRGDRVLLSGRLLRPQELGALAEMGRHTLAARRRPRVGVLATGDELVPVTEIPGPGQIRNSNETMLIAQIHRAGGIPVSLGIARDERQHLSDRILAGLECDILLLSGGVSAGKLDLVPSELEAAGVRQVFHKVKVKPGKPIWFGVLESGNAASESTGCYVFGLPGNPVSSMVCFELFVRTAIRRLLGIEPAVPQPVQVKLTVEHIAKGDRPTYFPAQLDWTPTGPTVAPIRWHGSADLRATVEANSMALFPAGDQVFSVGATIDVIPWD